MNYILFDGKERDHLLPLTFTRPVAEIRVGMFAIREKWEKMLGAKVSWITVPYLSEKFPAVIRHDNLFINGSILPDEGFREEIGSLGSREALCRGDNVLAARLPAGMARDFRGKLPQGVKERTREAEVKKIDHLWDIFLLNGEQIRADIRYFANRRDPGSLGQGNILIEPGNIVVEEGARADACVINASNGPVYLGPNSTVMEGSVIRGPFAMGENSVVKLGAKIYENSSLGDHCKVGGEINNVVFFSFSSKQHDGYLGNSVIGEWCNIGAGSNNSNLKNNYARVKLWNYPGGRFIDTGLQFCGLFMADHSKCGIQTMFNTGTVVGVSANIFGDGFPRNFIPSFSWGGAQGFSEYKLEKAFGVADTVMRRRGKTLDDTDRKILAEIFRLTKSHRSV